MSVPLSGGAGDEDVLDEVMAAATPDPMTIAVHFPDGRAVPMEVWWHFPVELLQVNVSEILPETPLHGMRLHTAGGVELLADTYLSHYNLTENRDVFVTWDPIPEPVFVAPSLAELSSDEQRAAWAELMELHPRTHAELVARGPGGPISQEYHAMTARVNELQAVIASIWRRTANDRDAHGDSVAP